MNRNELRNALRKRDGTKCHYCGIEDEDIPKIWGKIYGGKTRKRLEVEHKDSSQGDTLQNCVLACPVCNIAKSDIFTYEEFKRVGDVIKEIWQQRKKLLDQQQNKLQSSLGNLQS